MFSDFDGDDMLGLSDLKQVIERLTGPNNLKESDIKHLIQNVLAEADLDDDGALSYPEFEHVIDKASDFSKYEKKYSIFYKFHFILSNFDFCFYFFSSFRIRL